MANKAQKAPINPNVNIGFIFNALLQLIKYVYKILPIAPPAEINPNARDLTTAGNNSEMYTYVNAQTIQIKNLIIYFLTN